MIKFQVIRFMIPTTPATLWQIGTDGLLYMDAVPIATVRPELLAELLASAAEFTEYRRTHMAEPGNGPTRRESK